jgi:glycerol-3-phosphate dehydrogenase (NAD(P)+)
MADRIGVIGAGAFGTALAVAQAAAGREVTLWARDPGAVAAMEATRENAGRLPGVTLPDGVVPTADFARAAAAIVLLAVPTQSLRGLLEAQAPLLADRVLVACCKGVELGTGLLPSEVIADVLPGARAAVLTGPSFAADIAEGKPTALTLAASGPGAEDLQEALSTRSLRLYLTDDLIGAQLGAALKNVIAIAAGVTVGAGLGESARAALMTRGFAEMTRHAEARGRGERDAARPFRAGRSGADLHLGEVAQLSPRAGAGGGHAAACRHHGRGGGDGARAGRVGARRHASGHGDGGRAA